MGPVVPMVLLYLLACAVCGFMGRNTRAGALGHFLLAVLLTPFGDFLFQWAGRPTKAYLDKIRGN